jgi:hypothetical protein
MPGILSVDEITDSTGTRPVNCPNGVTTTELVAGEMVSNTWKNSDGTENYKCRAWVNFDGTTTPPTIRASGNVSSVTKTGTGDYTVNFATVVPPNPNVLCTSIRHAGLLWSTNPESSSARVAARTGTDAAYDSSCVCVSVFV